MHCHPAERAGGPPSSPTSKRVGEKEQTPTFIKDPELDTSQTSFSVFPATDEFRSHVWILQTGIGRLRGLAICSGSTDKWSWDLKQIVWLQNTCSPLRHMAPTRQPDGNFCV